MKSAKLQRFLLKFADRRVRLWWFALFLLSVCSFVDICFAAVFEISEAQRWILLISVAGFKATMLLAMGLLIWRRRWTHYLLYFCFAGYALLSVINVGSWGFYGFGISRRLVNLVSQSNLHEAVELLPEILDHFFALFRKWSTWFWFAVTGTAFILFIRMSNKVYAGIVLSLSLVGLSSAGWFGVNYSSGRTGFAISARLTKYSLDTYRANKELERYIADIPPLPHPDSIKNTHNGAETVIVIVGESASPDHMSVYGYGLETTPRMSAMKDSLIVMKDALSSAIFTITSLENMLTFRPDTVINLQWTDYPPILELFNRAGVRTYWLSNQERAGLWANSIGALTAPAAYVKFVGREYSEDTMLTDVTYDEGLLPVARRCLADSAHRRLMFLHLMGSHYKYDKRYPSSRTRFTGKDVDKLRPNDNLSGSWKEEIAAYDNSIAYTDSIWGEVIGLVSGSSEPSLVIYLSDHGENVYDGTAGFRGRDKEHARVPFVIYANGAYCRKYPSMVERMNKAVKRPFSTASLVNILSDLMGIDYYMCDSKSNPFSGNFKEHQRYVSDFEP